MYLKIVKVSQPIMSLSFSCLYENVHPNFHQVKAFLNCRAQNGSFFLRFNSNSVKFEKGSLSYICQIQGCIAVYLYIICHEFSSFSWLFVIFCYFCVFVCLYYKYKGSLSLWSNCRSADLPESLSQLKCRTLFFLC